MEQELRIREKIEFIHDIYETAISEANRELVDKFGFNLLFIEPNFKSVAGAYKDIFYKIKDTDKKIEQHPELKEDWDILRFKLCTAYKGLYDILRLEFNIEQVVVVGEDRNNWMFIK